MAAMTTALTEFSDSSNRREYTAPGHTVFAPRRVIASRTVANNAEASSRTKLQIVYGTTDSDGTPLSAPVGIDLLTRFPVAGKDSDVDSVIALARDFVASDEFESWIKTQNWPS
jgi:hypothetical protein